jgi:tetratricopeptide (TPR) repeat protein
MDPGKAQVAQQFARDLRQLLMRAGRPSYSTLERVSRHELKRATISDILNGNRVKLPDWGFVATFVEACHTAAVERKLDPWTLPSLADWKRHWDGAIDLMFQADLDQARLADWERHWDATFNRITDVPAAEIGQSPRAGEGPVRAPGPSDPWSPGAGDSGLVGPLPSLWGQVPPRLTDFVGREAWLLRLREALASKDRDRPVVIQGLCGIGKTQLAARYAYRYGGDYDLVWWIPCGDLKAAQGAMADLESALDLGGDASGLGGDASTAEREGRYAKLFDALHAGQPCERWLLVFDNANEADEIRDLIPPSTNGHVLITSRESGWEGTGDLLELDVFSRQESIEFQRRRTRRFNEAAAHQLADAVGDLPLLLEHAVESRLAIAQYISRLDADPLDLIEGQPSDYQGTIAGEWRTIIGQLRDRAPNSLELLCCLCSFGSGPIPRESLDQGSHIRDVSIYNLLRDPNRRRGAISMLRRAGLLRVRADDQALEVHRVTRSVVRGMMGTMGVADADQLRHDVHLMVAAIDPLDPEEPANWGTYDDLHGHAVESGAEACSDESVRKLVVNLTRFLTTSGDPSTALSMADKALAHWAADGGGERSEVPDVHLAMLQAKVGALLACGRGPEASQLQQDLLAMMRTAPDNRWETELMMLTRAVGVHWRAAGNFREAQAADLESASAHLRKFGRVNPQTFLAINEVIADLALNGDYAEAGRHARRVCDDCLAFYNDPSHPVVLFHRNALGRCLWLSGRYDDAVAILADANERFEDVIGRGILDQDHPWCLAHEIDYAVARRDQGSPDADLEALADRMQDVRRWCWRGLGADHPQTLAATVALGSILRRITGRSGEAARLIADAERRYRATLPDHPYGYACKACLDGMSGTVSPTGRSVPDLTAAIARLTADVGDQHPLTLTVMTGLANTLAETGELDAALTYGQQALAAFQAKLGAGHPHALACEANVTTIRAWLGQEADLDEIRARYEAAVGVGHRDVQLFAEGRLVYIDFTPLPL